MNIRVGLGYDTHPFSEGKPLVLGGVSIAGPGLDGHSDADAVTHAVADAILGAANLGDLATLFPASDDQYAGISSMVLLKECATRVAEAGWGIVNVDVVVNAEQPKLAPHISEMVENLSSVLSGFAAEESVAINVKPKHGEGIGFVGRSEGIACWAVALLTRD